MNIESNNENLDNPLADLISTEVYELLSSKGLINEKSVRDYQMRKRFKELRSNKVSAAEALNVLRDEYPYLQADSIKKIVYHKDF
ncbi:MAG: hypothetical protein V1720_20275 [bacterium]